MTVIEILKEIVKIRERMLRRVIDARARVHGAVSDEDVDETTLDVLEAQLRLARAEALQKRGGP